MFVSVYLFLYPSNLLAPLTVLSLHTSPKIFQFHAANSGLVEAEHFRAQEDSPAGKVTERREVEETLRLCYEDTEKIIGERALPGEGGDLFVTGDLPAEDFKTRGKRSVITKESESERKLDDLQKSPDRKFSVPKPDSPTGNVEIKDTKKVPKEGDEASESNKTKTESTGILIQPVFCQKPVIESQTEGEKDEVDKTQMLFTVTDCEPVDRNITQKELKFVHVDVTSETQETDSSGLSKKFKKASAKPRRDETQERAESKDQTVSAGKALRFNKDSPKKQTKVVEKLSKDAPDKDLNKILDVWLKDSRVEAEDKILRVPTLTKEKEQLQSKAADVAEEMQPSAAELEEIGPASENAFQPAEGKGLETFLDKTAETHAIKSESVSSAQQKKTRPAGIIVEQEQLKMRPVRDQTCPGKGTQTPQEQAVTPVTEINPRDVEIANECSNFAAGAEVSQESDGKERRSLQDKKQHQSVRPEEAAEKQITPKLVSVRGKTSKVTQEKDIPAREHSKHRDFTTQAVPSEETGTAGREKTTKPQGVVVEKDKDETAADHHLKNRDFATESSAFDKETDSTTNESVCPQNPQQKPAKLQGIVVERDQLKFGTVTDQVFRVPLTKETKAAEQADRKVPPLLAESSRDVETTPEKLVSEGFPLTESVSGGQYKSPQAKEVTVTEIIMVEEEPDTARDATSVQERQIRTTLDKTHQIVRERRAREEQSKKETDTLPEVEETGDTCHEKGKTLRAAQTQHEHEDGTSKDFTAVKIKPVVERTKIVPHEYKKTRQDMKGVVKGGEKTEIQAEKDELETSDELETVQSEENQTTQRQNIQLSPESESDDAVSKKSKPVDEKSTNVSPEETQSEVVVVKTKSGSVAPLEVEQTAKLSLAPVVEVTCERSPVVEEGTSDAVQSFASPEEKVFRTDRDEPEKSKVQEVHNETWKVTGILGKFSETEKHVEGKASGRNQREVAGQKALVEEPTAVVRSTAAVTAVTDGSAVEKTLAGKDAESGLDIPPSSVQPDREQRTVSIRKDKPVARQNEKETLTGRVAEEKEIKEKGQETAHELNSSRKCRPSKTGSKADIAQQESSAREPSVTDQIQPNTAAAATDAGTEAAAKQPSHAAEVGRFPPQAVKTKMGGEAPGLGSVLETKVSSLDPERKERVLSQEPSRGTEGQIFCVTEHMVLILHTKHPRAPPVKHRLLDLSAPFSSFEEGFHPPHSTHSVWARLCLLSLDQCPLGRAGFLLNHLCDVCFMFCPLLPFMWLIVWGPVMTFSFYLHTYTLILVCTHNLESLPVFS